MPSDRRNFLQTLFASPAVVAAANERERVRTEQEQLAKSALPALPIALCDDCKQPLVKGVCQFKKRCNFCTRKSQLEAYEHRAKTGYDTDYGPIFTHFVEDKCIECGNGQMELGYAVSSCYLSISSFSQIPYGMTAPDYDFRARTRKL